MATIRDWTSLAAIGLLFFAIMLAALVSGCAYTKATTEVYVDPVRKVVRFIDTKDNELSLESVTYSETPDGTVEFVLTGLNILNEASPVATANVQQMLAFSEQQRAANEGIDVALTGLTNLTAEVVTGIGWLGRAIAAIMRAFPGVEVDVDTPWGSGGVTVEDRAPPSWESEGDTGSNGLGGGP